MGIPSFDAGDRVTTLSLEGRLDAATINSIQTEFMAKTVALKKPVLVDMSQVTFMASLCIRMLVEAAKGLKTSGARLALLKPSPLVERALKASGFHQVVGIFHDEETARQNLAGS
jgi:anti-sigma B factor antagonist